ncbi:MAG TPA: spermidine synthase, partial [Candidatus Brocadiaceae bacterium]
MQNKAGRISIFSCIAAIGCYATITQVMLIREFLNIFYGNELCLGVVFGAWFLGIAVGALAGAKVERNFNHAFSVFTIMLLIMCFVLPVQIFSVRGVRSLLSVGVGEYISLLLLLVTSIGLILPFSFIIGFIFPFSSKVILGVTKDAATDIGVIYIIESIGSLIGGLLFSFYMVSRFHPFKIITLLNIGMFALLTFLFFSFQRNEQVYFREENKKITSWISLISLGLVVAMTVIWFSPIPDRIETFSTKLRWNTLNPNIELMASTDSKYQHIDIGRQAEQFSIYLNGQYAAAFPNEYEYAQIAHLVMTQHPSPKHILLIGNGLGGLISEMLRYPIESLDYVELDQNLLQISGKYLPPSDKQSLSDRRVTVIHQDGRYFVKHTSKKQYYDIMVINTPDPSTAFLNRFYTLEFFKEAQTILKSEGVLAASVSSAVTYIGKEVGSYTGSLYRTMHKAFQHVRVTPGQTNFYFASNTDGVVALDIETLTERYRKQQVKSDYFTEYLFYTLLQPEQVKFIESQLSQRKDLLVNTDARPVTYFLNLVLWDSLTGGRLHELFHGLKDVSLQSFLIPIAIALAGRIIYVVLRQFKQRRKDDKH